ncbi:MAG: hypothetical protein ACTIMI_04730 [Brochothrix thermosphacta]
MSRVIATAIDYQLKQAHFICEIDQRIKSKEADILVRSLLIDELLQFNNKDLFDAITLLYQERLKEEAICLNDLKVISPTER